MLDEVERGGKPAREAPGSTSSHAKPAGQTPALGCPGGVEPLPQPGSQPGAQTSARTPEQEHGGRGENRTPASRSSGGRAHQLRYRGHRRLHLDERGVTVGSIGGTRTPISRLTAGRSSVELRWKERGAAAVWATATTAWDAASTATRTYFGWDGHYTVAFPLVFNERVPPSPPRAVDRAHVWDPSRGFEPRLPGSEPGVLPLDQPGTSRICRAQRARRRSEDRGRASGDRTLIDRLRAGCSAIELIPLSRMGENRTPCAQSRRGVTGRLPSIGSTRSGSDTKWFGYEKGRLGVPQGGLTSSSGTGVTREWLRRCERPRRCEEPHRSRGQSATDASSYPRYWCLIRRDYMH